MSLEKPEIKIEKPEIIKYQFAKSKAQKHSLKGEAIYQNRRVNAVTHSANT